MFFIEFQQYAIQIVEKVYFLLRTKLNKNIFIIWKTERLSDCLWIDSECQSIFPVFLDAGEDWSVFNIQNS